MKPNEPRLPYATEALPHANSGVMQQMHVSIGAPVTERPHLFSPLYHSNVGAGTAVASHLSRAVRPRPIPWIFISWMVGATGEYEEIKRVVRSQTPVEGSVHVISSKRVKKEEVIKQDVQC